jgi:hypothetical protein
VHALLRRLSRSVWPERLVHRYDADDFPAGTTIISWGPVPSDRVSDHSAITKSAAPVQRVSISRFGGH